MQGSRGGPGEPPEYVGSCRPPILILTPSLQTVASRSQPLGWMEDGALPYWGLEATAELTVLLGPASSLQPSSPSFVLQEPGFYRLYPPDPFPSISTWVWPMRGQEESEAGYFCPHSIWLQPLTSVSSPDHVQLGVGN